MNTALVRISCVSIFAMAHWVVICYNAESILATGARAGICAFKVFACRIGRTVGIKNASWTAARLDIATVLRLTLARAGGISFDVDRVRATNNAIIFLDA